MSEFESVKAAFTAIADKNSDLLWLVAKWDKNQLSLVATGKGDLSEFKEHLAPNGVFFGIYKIYGVDEQETVTSKRDKLVNITFVGASVSPLARNAVLSSKPSRVETFKGCAAESQFDDADAITEKYLAKQLLLSGGAHKPTHYQFGTVKVPLSEL